MQHTLHDAFDDEATIECITMPRIYVACVSSYSRGKIHGEWIEASQDVEELRQAVEAMLDVSPTTGAKEFAIHDYENFGDVEICERESLETVARIAQGIVEHGQLYSALVAYYGGDLDEAEQALKERYAGAWDSLESFAEELLRDAGLLEKVPQALRYYVDIAAYGQDLELGGDIRTFRINDLVHVVRMH